MLFSIGIETPEDDSVAYSIVVPALCIEQYSCYSAADTDNDIAHMATEVIKIIVETMQEEDFAVIKIKDLGITKYQAMDEYACCDKWLLLQVDI